MQVIESIEYIHSLYSMIFFTYHSLYRQSLLKLNSELIAAILFTHFLSAFSMFSPMRAKEAK